MPMPKIHSFVLVKVSSRRYIITQKSFGGPVYKLSTGGDLTIEAHEAITHPMNYTLSHALFAILNDEGVVDIPERFRECFIDQYDWTFAPEGTA